MATAWWRLLAMIPPPSPHMSHHGGPEAPAWFAIPCGIFIGLCLIRVIGGLAWLTWQEWSEVRKATKERLAQREEDSRDR